MSDSILDGTGDAFSAKVDSKYRLFTKAVIETGGIEASLNGDNYNINTEIINLTSANKSACLYLKNNDTLDWVIQRVFYNIGNSTGGSGDMLLEVLANPTAGTIVSGTDITPHNFNFGSNKVLLADAKKGAEGSTFTDGIVRVSTLSPIAGTRILIGFDAVIVPVGSSIGIDVTPPIGNTSMDIQVGLNLHRFTD